MMTWRDRFIEAFWDTVMLGLQHYDIGIAAFIVLWIVLLVAL